MNFFYRSQGERQVNAKKSIYVQVSIKSLDNFRAPGPIIRRGSCFTTAKASKRMTRGTMVPVLCNLLYRDSVDQSMDSETALLC